MKHNKIISIFLSLTLVFLMAFAGISEAYETPQSSYQTSSTRVGDYMYYSVYNKIYKVNVKTKTSTLVKNVDKGMVYGLVVKDGWIYCTLDAYNGTDNSYPYVYKVRTNGKDGKVLTKGCFTTIYNDKIYYIKTSFTEGDSEDYPKVVGIYKMSLSGKSITCVKKSGSITDFIIYKSNIYYTSLGSSKMYLKRMSLSGKNTTTIASSSSKWIENLKAYSGYIYFNYGDDIYRVKTDSTSEKKFISNAALKDINSGYIYYTVEKNDQDYLYKNKIGSSSRTYLLKKDIIGNVEVSNGYMLMDYCLLNATSSYNTCKYICSTSGKSGKILAKYFLP